MNGLAGWVILILVVINMYADLVMSDKLESYYWQTITSLMLCAIFIFPGFWWTYLLSLLWGLIFFKNLYELFKRL